MGVLTDKHVEDRKIPLGEIFSNEEFNCRGQIMPQSCVDLANSIKVQGLMYPVFVQPLEPPKDGKLYDLLVGFRRFMAHRINKADTIDAKIIYGLTPSEAALLNMSENLIRADLNTMQEARAIQRFKAHYSMTHKQIAEQLQKSPKWVQIRLWALELEPAIQADIESGMLKQQNIEALHTLPPGEPRYAAVRAIKAAKMRGEKPRIVTKKATPFKRRKRDQSDVAALQDHILDSLGGGDFTRLPREAKTMIRALGWTMAQATDMEVYTTLREIAEIAGLEYEIPEEVLSAVQG